MAKSNEEHPPYEKLPPSVAELINRINSDPVTRARLVSRFTDTLIDLGVKPEEINLVSSVDIVKSASDAERVEDVNAFIFTSQSDTRRNTRSAIIF